MVLQVIYTRSFLCFWKNWADTFYMISTKNLPRRVVCYCIGLLLLAFGVTFSVRSDLGVSPVNSIPYVLSLITGADQGLLTTGVFCSYILLQFLLLFKEFKPINLLQIVFASIFGYFVTFSNHLWAFFPSPDHYAARLLLLAVSMVSVALGLMCYLAADIVPQPAEGVMLAIQIKTGVEFSRIKVIFDLTVVIIAGVISCLAFGQLRGIGEGTVIAAVGIGKILGVLNKKYRKSIDGILYSR